MYKLIALFIPEDVLKPISLKPYIKIWLNSQMDTFRANKSNIRK